MVVVALEVEGALRQAQTIPAGCTSGPIREARSVVHPVPISSLVWGRRASPTHPSWTLPGPTCAAIDRLIPLLKT